MKSASSIYEFIHIVYIFFVSFRDFRACKETKKKLTCYWENYFSKRAKQLVSYMQVETSLKFILFNLFISRLDEVRIMNRKPCIVPTKWNQEMCHFYSHINHANFTITTGEATQRLLSLIFITFKYYLRFISHPHQIRINDTFQIK